MSNSFSNADLIDTLDICENCLRAPAIDVDEYTGNNVCGRCARRSRKKNVRIQGEDEDE